MSFYFAVFALVEVSSHVCLLWKRPDPSNGGLLRLSLSYEEMCLCKMVIIAREGSHLCPRGNTIPAPKWFYVDSPTPLTLRENWNIEALDDMFNRTKLCGKSVDLIAF